MNIALIGATGFTGSAILDEALARGHSVIALAGKPEKLSPRPGMTARRVDVMDVASLTAQLQGADVVISAFSGHAQADVLGYYLAGVRRIMDAAKEARAPRLLMIGGAGSLFVAPGLQLLDTPAFPAEYKPTAEGARQALALLKAEPELDWTMLSPSAMLAPGKRTGVFRLGTDQLLVDAEGNSTISVEDLAMALMDEVETPAYKRARFTVGY